MRAGRGGRLVDVCGGDASRLTALDVYTAAQDGDALAHEFLSDAVRFLTMSTANYVTLLNPHALVMGGGVIETVPALFDALVDAVPRLTTILSGRSLRIERARLGDLSGLIGAASLATPA
jgi:glucokinase